MSYELQAKIEKETQHVQQRSMIKSGLLEIRLVELREKINKTETHTISIYILKKKTEIADGVKSGASFLLSGKINRKKKQMVRKKICA